LSQFAVKEKEFVAVSVSEGTPEQVRRRRQWELWSVQDTNSFFEGLFEACDVSHLFRLHMT